MAEAMQKQMPVAIHDCHHLLAWMIPQLDHFPGLIADEVA